MHAFRAFHQLSIKDLEKTSLRWDLVGVALGHRVFGLICTALGTYCSILIAVSKLLDSPSALPHRVCMMFINNRIVAISELAMED
jgi:hypothetical protein